MLIKRKKVLVLMSTYNGEKYLNEQINSLLRQEAVDLEILVRDDGSSDSTLSILKDYSKNDLLTWYNGANLRSAKSFMDLINNAYEADYYAFCDQDDIWNSNKLYIAISELEKVKEKDLPALYCSNYQLVDEKLNNLPDNSHVSTTTFNAALVSSCATGCTVVFNYQLLKILQKYNPENIVMHDDWAHKVCLAVNGIVIYDSGKMLKYRQHGNNVDGGQHSVKKRLQGIVKRIIKKDCIRSKQIQELLNGYSEQMSLENYEMAYLVANYKKNINLRIKLLFSHTVITPFNRLNRGFKVAVLLGYF